MSLQVLITGGGGFIGSHLVESQLAHGHRVRTVDLQVGRLAALSGRPGLEVVQGDITDPVLIERLVEKVDIVYHLASAHLDVSLGEAEYRRVNVEATLSLIRQACNAGARRFIHCSTNGVYGSLKQLPADETTPCNPTNLYEKTKLAGERAALQAARENGLPLVVIRPSWVYGPGCPRTEKLFRTVRKGRFVFFGDGRTLRQPIFITDAVRGMEQCAAAEDRNGEIYLLAGEAAVSIQELVQQIAEVLDIRLVSVHLPVSLGLFAGRLLQWAYGPLGKQPPFSQRSLDFFVKNNAYDLRKAHLEVGFQPQVDLRTGLIETRDWLSRSKRTV